MSNLINPLFVDNYIDDEIGKSVQGCYTGTLNAPQEAMLDKKLKAEREARKRLKNDIFELRAEFNKVLDRIVAYKKRNKKQEAIDIFRARLLEIRLEIDRLEKIRI